METGSLIKSWLNLHWGKITDESVGAVWSDEETATFPKLIQKNILLKRTIADQFDEHVCMHQHINDTLSPLQWGRNASEHTFLYRRHVCLLILSWKHFD